MHFEIVAALFKRGCNVDYFNKTETMSTTTLFCCLITERTEKASKFVELLCVWKLFFCVVVSWNQRVRFPQKRSSIVLNGKKVAVNIARECSSTGMC